MKTKKNTRQAYASTLGPDEIIAEIRAIPKAKRTLTDRTVLKIITTPGVIQRETGGVKNDV